MRTSGKQQATRYVAFLRGVSPVNAKMADLRACFEAMGFTEVRTILSSGNVVFTSAPQVESTLARSIEAGMSKHLARSFLGQPHQGSLSLPIELGGARVLYMIDQEVFTDYVPCDQGPVFMTLIEKTFGKNITTRTWDTVRKCATA